MVNKNNTFAGDSRIQVDKMSLTVTNIYPDFQKKSQQEIPKEISAELYRTFKKYE